MRQLFTPMLTKQHGNVMDGYFNNEMFIEQVDSALQIFGRKFPRVIGIIFLCTKSHAVSCHSALRIMSDHGS